MPNFPQIPLSTLIFQKSPILTPVALFAQSLSLKATILPKRPDFHLKFFRHTHFPYEPCFHRNSRIFAKVSLSHTHFSQKPNFLPKWPTFLKVHSAHLFPQKPYFNPSSPFCTAILPLYFGYLLQLNYYYYFIVP